MKQGTHLRVTFHRHNCDSFAAVNCHAVYHIHSKTAQKVEKWVLSYCFYSLTVQTNSHNHIGLFAARRFIWWSNLYCHSHILTQSDLSLHNRAPGVTCCGGTFACLEVSTHIENGRISAKDKGNGDLQVRAICIYSASRLLSRRFLLFPDAAKILKTIMCR